MKQKTIKIKVETPQVTEVEIALPFYGVDNPEKPRHYIKVETPEKAISLTKWSNDDWSYFTSDPLFISRPSLSEFYPIEKQEFDMAFAEFVESISNI